MSHAPAEAAALVPAFAAPEYLRKKCAEMQREAPNFRLGYKKGRLPKHVHERLLAHFREHLEHFRPERAVDEIRTAAKATIPTLLLSDNKFNVQLAEDLQPLHEEWASTPLVLSACYGIRCYQRGTFLYNHVDRQPHFVSSSICVDHALDSPWPLHIESPDGVSADIQINMEPGDYVLYEGARLAHGRPYPLNGEFYAGIFAHYYPADFAVDRARHAKHARE